MSKPLNAKIRVIRPGTTGEVASLSPESLSPSDLENIANVTNLDASRQVLRGNDTMGKSVQKIEEKEGNCDSPTDITRVGCSNACRPPSAV